jgi:cell division protein FtsW
LYIVLSLYIILWLTINILCMSIWNPYIPFERYSIILLISGLLFAFISTKLKRHEIKYSSFLTWIVNLSIMIFLIASKKNLKGSARWIIIYGISYQPSELLKISFIIIFTLFLSQKRWGLCISIYLLTIATLLLQPDIGSVIILSVTSLIVLYAANTRKRILFYIVSLLSINTYFIAKMFSHSSKRIALFMNKSSIDPFGPGYQNLRAIQAIQNGGLFGVGTGNGVIKKFLPDAYSDFVFAIIGEELGLIGCMIIFLSFLLFFIQFIPKDDNNSFESLAITGLVSCITIQAWIHMASVLWIIPTKGTTLPFISHGGTSLIASFIALGLLYRLRYYSNRDRCVV